MWPCRPSNGLRSSSISRTAVLPTAAYCTWPTSPPSGVKMTVPLPEASVVKGMERLAPEL